MVRALSRSILFAALFVLAGCLRFGFQPWGEQDSGSSDDADSLDAYHDVDDQNDVDLHEDADDQEDTDQPDADSCQPVVDDPFVQIAGSNHEYWMFFNSGTGSEGDRQTSDYHWSVHYGQNAEVSDGLFDSTYISGVSQGRPPGQIKHKAATIGGFLYAVGTPDGPPPVVAMIWTTNFESGSADLQVPQSDWYAPAGSPQLSELTLSRRNLRSLRFFTANPSDDTTVRFALRIAGAWFVSDATWNNTQDFSEEHAAFDLDILGSRWHPVTFTPGENLDAELPCPTHLIPDGTIDAVGTYSTTGDSMGELSRTRIEDYRLLVIVP